MSGCSSAGAVSQVKVLNHSYNCRVYVSPRTSFFPALGQEVVYYAAKGLKQLGFPGHKVFLATKSFVLIFLVNKWFFLDY